MKTTSAVQTLGVPPLQLIGPTVPGVPWLVAPVLVAKLVTASPSGSVADSAIVTGVSSSVVADVGPGAGGSAVSTTEIANASANVPPRPSLARMRTV